MFDPPPTQARLDGGRPVPDRPRRWSGPATGGEAGTALLLFPAAVLVVLILAAIAVDLSQVHLARQELGGIVGHAADDAASLLDVDAVRSGDLTAIDLRRARAYVAARVRDELPPGDAVSVRVVPGPRPGTIEVTASRSVQHAFARGVPGLPESEVVSVHVVAELLVSPS